MSHSRYLRIAMAIAAGMASSEMICTDVYATVASHAWPAARPSRAMSKPATKPTAVRTSHLICCRSSELR
jgi:hypothetical protein